MIVGSAVLFAVNGIAAKSILASGHLDATRLVSLQATPVAIPGAPGVTMPLWAPLAFLMLGGTVAAYLLVLAGIKRIGAPVAGLLGMAEPILIALLGWVLLAETLTGWQVAGVCIAVAGMMLAASARRRGVPATPEPAASGEDLG